MGTATFDTLKFARRLKAADVPEKQAEAEAEAIKEALSEAMDTQLATKTDIHRLERGQDAIRATLRLHGWMLGVALGFLVTMFWRMFIS